MLLVRGKIVCNTLPDELRILTVSIGSSVPYFPDSMFYYMMNSDLEGEVIGIVGKNIAQ